MCDLHDRLIDLARAMGARDLSIRHGGGRGGARRFRKHPHLVGTLDSKPFQFSIKSRPRDASNGYRETYLRKLELYLLARGGKLPATVASPPPATHKKKKKRRHAHRVDPSYLVETVPDWSHWSCAPPATELSDTPFACLAILRDRLAKSSTT